MVLFIDWLDNCYNFPQHYVTLALFGIVSIIEGLKAKLSWLQQSKKKSLERLQPRTMVIDPFHYSLSVIEVVDSTAITKVHVNKPNVKIRVGDLVGIH